LPSDKQKQSGLTDKQAGLPWPKQYKALLSLIRKEWGLVDALYLNRMLGGGRSGALVFATDVTCRGFKGQAILKLDTANPSDWSEAEEFESHRIAVEAAPEYAAEHLPRLVHATKKNDQIAILSTIAGRGLEYATPWAESPYTQQLEFGRRVSADLLEEWNADYTFAKGLLGPRELLEGWLGYRLDPEEGRIGNFLTECGIEPNEPSFSFRGEWYPNPFAFAKRVLPLPKKTRMRAIRGQTHGDLHGHNILIASPPGSRRQYYLIDLDLYRRDDFLFFDHAYLEFTHLLNVRDKADANRWKSILDNLSRSHVHSGKSAPKGDDMGLLKLMLAIRKNWLNWVNRHEPNRLSNMENQYLLARIAVGLMFTHRGLPLHGRCMAFTYAAANLKDYLELNGIDWPMNGPALEFPAETQGSSNNARPVQVKAEKLPAQAQKSSISRTPSIGWIAAAAVLLLAIGAGGMTWWHHRSAATPPASSDTTAQVQPVERVEVAVLPFRNLSKGAASASLADVMEESLTMSLNEVPRIFVKSLQTGSGNGMQINDLQAIGKALDVRYVVTGSVQESGERVRIAARLVDIKTNELLWSQRYDRKIENIFAVQDEIALRVLIALQVKLTEGAQAALRGQSTKNLDAYLLYARGLGLYRTFSRDAMRQVRRLMDQALELDPKFSSALVLKARTYAADARFGFSPSSRASLVEASKLLWEAARLDGKVTDAELGEIKITDAYVDLLARRFGAAQKAAEKAVELVPENADASARLGSIFFFTGDYSQAIRSMKRAVDLRPIYPGWYSLYLSRAYAYQGEFDQAIKWAKDGLARVKSDTMRTIMSASLAFVYQEAGKKEEAEAAARSTLTFDPDFSVEAFSKVVPFQHDKDWQRMAKAMEAAGLPE